MLSVIRTHVFSPTTGTELCPHEMQQEVGAALGPAERKATLWPLNFRRRSGSVFQPTGLYGKNLCCSEPLNLWSLPHQKPAPIPVLSCYGVLTLRSFLLVWVWECCGLGFGDTHSVFCFLPWLSVFLCYTFFFSVSYYYWKSLKKFIPHSSRILLMTLGNNKNRFYMWWVYSILPGYQFCC